MMFLLVRRIRWRMPAWSRLVSWYSSTRMWSKRASIRFGQLLVGQQVIPEQQQVVVVQDVTGLLGVDVGLKEPLQLLLPFLAPREIGLQCVVQRVGTVDAARVDRQAGGLAREPLLLLGQPLLVADHVHQVFCVALVEDGETLLQANGFTVDTEQAVGHRVERAAPDTGGMGSGLGPGDPSDGVGPSDHLLGGPAGEGEQHDAARVDARADQVSDAVGERLGLARAGSGDDENRPVAGRRRRPLLRVQIIQPGKFRCNAFVKMDHKNSIAESPAGWQGIPSIAGMENRLYRIAVPAQIFYSKWAVG